MLWLSGCPEPWLLAAPMTWHVVQDMLGHQPSEPAAAGDQAQLWRLFQELLAFLLKVSSETMLA